MFMLIYLHFVCGKNLLYRRISIVMARMSRFRVYENVQQILRFWLEESQPERELKK